MQNETVDLSGVTDSLRLIRTRTPINTKVARFKTIGTILFEKNPLVRLALILSRYEASSAV
jgi:hypothetical protein